MNCLIQKTEGFRSYAVIRWDTGRLMGIIQCGESTNFLFVSTEKPKTIEHNSFGELCRAIDEYAAPVRPRR